MRIVRSIGGTLLCLVCLMILIPAAHAEAQYEATVVFTDISTTSDGVTLTGTMTNTGTDPLYLVQAVFWRDRTPLTTHDQLSESLAADPDLDTGDRMSAGQSIDVICSGTATFDPGESADFTVSATWDDMRITSDGVYLVGVHIRAASASWSSRVTIGRGRTLVTVANSTHASAATVVMLTSAPSLLHDDIFIDDHLADELTGRLGTLLTLARTPGVSWVIDPALIDEVSRMSQGYEVLTEPTDQTSTNPRTPTASPDTTPSGAPGTPDTTPGTGQTIATNWLAAFRTLSLTQGYRLPWGNPDLALAAASGADLVSPSQDENLPMYNLDSLPLVVRANNGQVDDAFLAAIAPLEPDIVLADAESNAVLPHGVLLATLPVPFPGGPGPDADTPLQQQQRALAEDATNPHTIRVISTEEDAELASYPAPAWVTPILLSSIQVQDEWSSSLSHGTPAGTLTPAALDAVRQTQSTIATYGSLITDPASASQLTATAMARLASGSWADDAHAAVYCEKVSQWVESIMDGVTLTATPEVSLTSHTASFPVTVTNKLDVPVTVRIITDTVPTGHSPANLTVPASDVTVIQPGDKIPILLSPTVVRDGDADVLLTLTTGDGYVLSSSATVHLHASSSSWMGWSVVGAAAILFVVGTFLRVRAKSRGTKTSQPVILPSPPVILPEAGSPPAGTTGDGDPDCVRMTTEESTTSGDGDPDCVRMTTEESTTSSDGDPASGRMTTGEAHE